MLLPHRPFLYLAALAASVTAVTPPVEAGCLCDWLFGTPEVVYPAAPAATPPAYSANYQPVYAAGYAPLAAAPAAAPAAPITTYRPPVNGAAAAQMPAYSTPATATPNGYAGVYSSYYGTAAAATADPAPVSSFYGTGNIYPDPLQGTQQAGFSANQAAAYPANQAAAYSSYYAPTPQAAVPTGAVIAPAPRRGLLGGVRRFFGSLFGTGYRTSYYRAPVTYYRPVTTVNPTTGATVTSQRACTGSQYQVQRSPVRSYQGASTPPAAPYNPGCGSEAPLPSAPRPANPAQAGEGYVPQPTLPANGFDPYASQRSTYDGSLQAAPPPASCYRSYPSYPADNTAPLSGPPGNGSNGEDSQRQASPQDQRTVPQPQLDPNTSALRGYRRMPENAAATNRSGWRSTAPAAAPPASATPPREARPIPAPPSLWPEQEERSPAIGQEATGRTAARPPWGSKKIQWASHRQPTRRPTPAAAAAGEPAGRLIAEPTAAADDAVVRQVDHVIPAAPHHVEPATPPRARPQPRRAPAPRRSYDDSGWE